jgi:hypothetical protein
MWAKLVGCAGMYLAEMYLKDTGNLEGISDPGMLV